MTAPPDTPRLLLVGALQHNPEPGDYRLEYSLFPRLTAEISQPRPLARILRYESASAKFLR